MSAVAALLGARQRDLSAAEYAAWAAEWRAAEACVTGRVEALAAAAAKIERDLSVLGATAIEDKLQARRRRSLLFCRPLSLSLTPAKRAKRSCLEWDSIC